MLYVVVRRTAPILSRLVLPCWFKLSTIEGDCSFLWKTRSERESHISAPTEDMNSPSPG